MSNIQLQTKTGENNINKKVEELKTDENNVNLTILGEDVAIKLISAIDAKGKFILAVIEIGKYILSKLLIAVGPCIEKNKNNWIEITNDSLLLIKKIGNSIDIQCIPAGVLGILTTISILPEIQKYFPNINIPFLDIDLPAIQPIILQLKNIWNKIDFSGIFNINIQELLTPPLLLCLMNLGERDYCYNLYTKR